MNKLEAINATKNILKEAEAEVDKRKHYEKELRKLILERKEQRKLDQLMMLSTLSPGGKMNWYSTERKSLGPDDISNPFVEKADIVNHKRKISMIDTAKEKIQTMYKHQTTWA